MLSVKGMGQSITIVPTFLTYTYNATRQFSFTTNIDEGASNDPDPQYSMNYVGTGTTVYGPSTFKPINAGTYQVSATLILDDLGTFNSTNSVDFTINKAPVTITDILLTKVYDGTPNVNVISNSSSGLISSDNVAIGGSATNFSDKIVGNNYSSTVTFNLITNPSTGKENNYFIFGGNQKSVLNGSITAKQLTIADPTITKIKEYDKTAAVASLTAGSLSGVVTVGSVTDAVTASAVGTYSTSTVGTAKTITVVYTLDGADKDNYIKPIDKVYTDGVITAKQLTITDPTITKSKEYDKTAAVASLTAGSLSGVVTVGSVTDAVTASAVGTYSTSTVGTAKTITVVYTLDGADKDNYIKPADKVYTDGEITARLITISATVLDKVYDGNTSATSTLTDNRVTGDDLTLNKTGATFNDKNIGTGKSVTVSGITLTGTDAGNYTLTSSTATGTASITVKSLTISATVFDKVYDGNTTATATLTDNRVTGDDLTINKTGITFINKNIGNGKVVTVNGITLTGTDAGNYTLTSATATGTASITVKSLTITTTVSDKVYDGNSNAVITFTDNRVPGDVLSTTKSGALFNSKNVGSNKLVTVNGITLTGTDAGNYSLTSSTATGTASITQKSIIITAIANDKVYDGNKSAIVVLSSNGLIVGDQITPSKILAEFDSPDVGNNKVVTVTGISIGGVDAGNYSLTNTTATTNASITAPSVIIFEIPNAFTPNGDGMNDELKIISNAGVRSLTSFKIYSRSGNLVFESRDLSKGWDGRYNNNLLPADIYYWTAVYVDRNNNSNPKTGTVLLLK